VETNNPASRFGHTPQTVCPDIFCKNSPHPEKKCPLSITTYGLLVICCCCCTAITTTFTISRCASPLKDCSGESSTGCVTFVSPYQDRQSMEGKIINYSLCLCLYKNMPVVEMLVIDKNEFLCHKCYDTVMF